MNELVRGCDVFAQGYRPGALERLGFGAAEIGELRPGAIHVSLSCFGTSGPWSDRRGWEQIAEASCGISAGHGTPDQPRVLPVPACDYITGYLAALGTIASLVRRARSGGTYSVEASLCRTATWMDQLGRCSGTPAPAAGVPDEWMTESDTAYGRLRHLAPVAQLSRTPARWSMPVEPPGSSLPTWAGPSRAETLSEHLS
jgi:hypothetical protein